MAMITIKVDYENNAEKFWQTVDSDLNSPFELKVLRTGDDEVTVSKKRAKEIETWCENVEGYSDGPDHAETAVLFHPFEID
jgi:hypothetical protein